METKLTLRMDENIIRAAKKYAQKQGVSLSKLVADYLRIISVKTNSSKNKTAFEPTPILSEITGVLQKASRHKDLREEYRAHLEEKYL